MLDLCGSVGFIQLCILGVGLWDLRGLAGFTKGGVTLQLPSDPGAEAEPRDA